jgi:hypothetical protein
MRVDLGHDQRHVGVVAPVARVIDGNAALGADARGPVLGDGRSRRHQREIDAGEIEVLEILHLHPLIAEAHLDPDRAGGSERDHFGHRKTPLAQDIEHFAANIAGGSDDGDTIGHFGRSFALSPHRSATGGFKLEALPGGEARGKRQGVLVVGLPLGQASVPPNRPIRGGKGSSSEITSVIARLRSILSKAASGSTPKCRRVNELAMNAASRPAQRAQLPPRSAV